MTIGERIQTARKNAKLSQKELGEKLGVSASMIGQWENNLRKPKFGTLHRIAEALNISTKLLVSDHVFYFEDYISVPATKTEYDADNDASVDTREGKLFNAFFELNDLGKDEAIRYIEMLLEVSKYKKQPQEE